MLYQLSYKVRSVRVGGIVELSLVPSISVCFLRSSVLSADSMVRTTPGTRFQD